MTGFSWNGDEQADFRGPWLSILEWTGDEELDPKSSWEPCVKKIINNGGARKISAVLVSNMTRFLFWPIPQMCIYPQRIERLQNIVWQIFLSMNFRISSSKRSSPTYFIIVLIIILTIVAFIVTQTKCIISANKYTSDNSFIWLNKNKLWRTRLEDGDIDLELSSVSTLSSWGDTATSGTGDSSISWKEEGLERVMRSTDKRLLPSGSCNFWKERLFLIHAFLPNAFSPHSPVEKKNPELVVVPDKESNSSQIRISVTCSQHILSFYAFQLNVETHPANSVNLRHAAAYWKQNYQLT